MALLASQEYINEITTCLSILAKKVSMCGRLNLTDTHVMSEDFYAGLLNIARGWYLKNANTEHPNAAGIDLVDDNARILVQVSATCTKKKIEDSLKGIDSAFKGYHFYFLPIITGTAKSQKKLRFIPPHEVVFDPQEDIIEMEDLIQALKSDVSGQRLKEADSYIRNNFRISLSDKDKAPSTPSYADLKDHLLKKLERVRKSHPSFRLMRIDQALFPDGVQEWHNLELHQIEAANDADVIKDVREIVEDSWKRERKNHLMIEGEGGIGKTVTLLWLPDHFVPHKVPAVFIQLHELKVVNQNETIKDYIKERYFLSDDALFGQFLKLAETPWQNGPRVLLLLDGFNEIAPERQYAIGQDIRSWAVLDGVQIVTTSRNNIIPHVQIREGFSKIKLQPLGRKTVEEYLNKEDIPLPEKESQWGIISLPLMLTLYAMTRKVKDSMDQDWERRYFRESNSAGAIIWNYLLMEIRRYRRRPEHADVLSCVASAEIIAPYVAWQMQREDKFYLSEEQLEDYVDDACKLANGLDRKVFPPLVRKVLPRGKEKPFDIDKVLPFIEQELFLFVKRSDGSYSLMHQQFRDVLAAMHLINASYFSDDLPEEWKASVNYYVMSFVAELAQNKVEEGEESVADRLWEQNRRSETKSDVSTVNMLELQGRKRNYDFRGLDFSGLDLHDICMFPYRVPGTKTLLLPRNPGSNKDLRVSKKTFYPEGHTLEISCLSITPDGKRCVSGSGDNTLRVWDIETGECLKTLEGHTWEIECLSITPDGKRCVSGSRDKTLRVWDIETGECLKTLEGHTDWIRCLSITPDGKRCVSGSDDETLRVWDIETGECLKTLEGHTDEIRCLSITPDGKRCVSGSDDDTLRVWDIESGECQKPLERHTDEIWCLSITPDGKRCVSGSRDKTLRVWDIETGKCLKTLEGHTGAITCLSITPDGKRCVSGSGDKTLRIWDIEFGQCLKTLEGHTGWISCLSITPDGKRCVSGSWDNTLRVWDIESGECLKTLEGHTYGITCLSITPDGKRCVSGALDKTPRVWDIETGQCLKTLEGHTGRIECLSITPDGKRCVSGSRDKTLRVWDIETGQCLQTLKGHAHGISCLSITPDGKHCVFSTMDTIEIIDFEDLDFSNVRTIHVLPVFLSGANFAQANVPEDLKETLRQNGASFVN